MAAKTKKPVARRPVSRRHRPALAFKKIGPTKRWRARSARIHLTRASSLKITLRRFRTQRNNRSRRLRQLVLPIPFISIREIAIAYMPAQGSRRSKPAPGLYQLRRFKITAVLPLVIGIIGLAYSVANLRQHPVLSLAPKHGQVLAEQSVPTPKTMPAATPVRLRIDKIDLSAPVVGINLKADGSLDTPPLPDEVGWYNGSPTPGQLGPSVIDGHVDQIGGIAIFWRLRELAPGDIIQVDRADDSTATFRVDALQEFPQDNFPTQQVYGHINYAGIRLITCGGEFNTDTHRYSHNIVVFGSLVQ